MAHVDALARIDEEVDADFALVLVRRRNRRDLRERVADVREHCGHRLGRFLDLLAREHVARLECDQLAHLVLAQYERAGELDVGDLVYIAFAQGRSQIHLALVRADRDLGRIDVEIDIAAVEVVRIEFFQVARQLFARVLIVTRIPRGPVRRVRLEVRADFLLAESLVADDVDALDLGNFAFGDVDRQLDAVAVEVDHRGLDRDVVLAAVVVLARQFLRHAVEREAVERLAFGQADVLQALEQVFFLEVLVALDLDLRDRWALFHRDHENAALAADLHIGEEAGLVQGAHGLLRAFGRDRIALFHWQIGEHGTGRDALQPVDTESRRDERIDGVDLGGKTGEQY